MDQDGCVWSAHWGGNCGVRYSPEGRVDRIIELPVKDDPLESDIAFHVALLKVSRNRFSLQLRELVETTLRFSIRTTNRYKGVRLGSVADHRKIANAIGASEPKRAAEATQLLIRETLDLIRRASNNRRPARSDRRRER